jgi:uroporphyrinogen III methyltransferase / synthase
VDPEKGAVWLVVTSRNTIPPLVEELDRQGGSVQALSGSGIKVAAVGSGTARALADAGLPPDLMPERFTGEDLLSALQGELGEGIRRTRILIPRAEEARAVLPQGLERAGAQVRVAPAYRLDADPAEAARLVREIRSGEVDVITFTSGSAVAALGEAWNEAGGMGWPQAVRIAVIGPVTEAAVQAEGWPGGLRPPTSTLEALAAAVLELHGAGSR